MTDKSDRDTIRNPLVSVVWDGTATVKICVYLYLCYLRPSSRPLTVVTFDPQHSCVSLCTKKGDPKVLTEIWPLL